MRILLETACHYLQQFGAEAHTFLDGDQIGEYFSTVEALEGLREDHGVNVDT